MCQNCLSGKHCEAHPFTDLNGWLARLPHQSTPTATPTVTPTQNMTLADIVRAQQKTRRT